METECLASVPGGSVGHVTLGADVRLPPSRAFGDDARQDSLRFGDHLQALPTLAARRIRLMVGDACVRGLVFEEDLEHAARDRAELIRARHWEDATRLTGGMAQRDA